MDTASEPTSLDIARSRRLYNAYQGKIRALTQRPGSVPVISTALDDPIIHLTRYPYANSVAIGAAPTLTAVAGTATLPTDTYYVIYTYVTDNGETEASAEASQAITLGESLHIVIPAIPYHANSINIYISNATTTETLQLNTTSLTTDITAPLITGIAYPTTNSTAFSNEILASSGTSLYSYYNGEFHEATMTNDLNSPDIYVADFTGINAGTLVNMKIIGDGGLLKQYDGNEVVDVTPAADDASPDPANVLTDINAKGCKYVWGHSQYVFVSPGTNEVFYSKRAGQAGSDNQFNYFPEVHFSILVHIGDYVNGCGVPFDNVQFIPMRKGWNVWEGTNFDDFDSSNYLNTINGVIAPRSIDIITYSTGTQTIAYLSDDGVHEIFTSTIDTKGRQYATRSLMENKIDFSAYGFTEAEKESAISKYIVQYSMYLLEITRETTTYIFGFDTRNAEWYIWTGLQINSFIEDAGIVYFAGDDGLLKKFDKDLNYDWTDISMTTGTPIDFDRISGFIWFEQTGYPSALDYYILRLKTYAVIASLDISIIYLQDLVEVAGVIQNSFLTWDISQWDVASRANLNYTDLVSAPQRLSHRLSLPKPGYYFQVRLRNNRSEPVELYSETFIGRPSGEI